MDGWKDGGKKEGIELVKYERRIDELLKE